MKLKLGEIRELVYPLQKLAKQELPIKTAWKLLKVSEKIESINDKIESFRVDLVKKYGTSVNYVTLANNNERVRLNDAELKALAKDLIIPETSESKIEVLDDGSDNSKKFYEELSQLLESEEVLEVPQLTLEELGESCKLSPTELYKLKPILLEK